MNIVDIQMEQYQDSTDYKAALDGDQKAARRLIAKLEREEEHLLKDLERLDEVQGKLERLRRCLEGEK